MDMKEIKFLKCSSEKNEGAHPLFLGARAPIISRGHEHSLFKEQPNGKQMNEHT